ncbi:MAG: hypothetical protein Q7U68_07685, partial [Candidatus Roizmanbacteria bacterium]|nr:hypothetical protein [Candidatus Roizmanbacteria bacterium]
MKKILNIVLILVLALSLLGVGFFMGYIQKKPENYKPETASELTSLIPTPTIYSSLKTLKVNGFDFSFEYQPTWQILANELIKEENGFSKKSIDINLDKPHIIGNFGFIADIMIVDYLPLPERESLTNIDDFINVIVYEEVSRSSFYNKNGVQFIKSEDKDGLRGNIIISYNFQYKDSNEKKHFVHLYTFALNNEDVLKAID